MRQGKPERPGLLRGQQQAQGTGDRCGVTQALTLLQCFYP